VEFEILSGADHRHYGGCAAPAKFVCFPQHSGTLPGYSEEADFKICGINAPCTFENFKTNDN
jgi:hypothetical protein